VESPRIELGSKQANKKPSTRLVFNWLSEINWLKTAHLFLSFFNFESLPKP